MVSIYHNSKDFKKKKNHIFSCESDFSYFNISPLILAKLNYLGYKKPTRIQQKCLPYALMGRDLMVSSETGSGKTLCFIIPIINNLFSINWSKIDTTGGYVICPMRELAIQIFTIFKNLCPSKLLSVALSIGGLGQSTKTDNNSIIIGTIGKLCEQILVSKNLNLDNLKILSIDEIDQILDLGFKRSFLQILKILPKKKQTLLFSATLSRKIKFIVRLNLIFPIFLFHKKKNNNEIKENPNDVYSIPKNIFQYYCVVDFDQKTNFLYSFLISHSKKKSIVLFSNNKQVSFFYRVFNRLNSHLQIYYIYGNLKQIKRTLNYISFNETTAGVLFATDLISRGLDLKQIDWVIQFDCPLNIKTYVHRIGRTGRLSESGRALLMLTKTELFFLKELNRLQINILMVHLRKKQLVNINTKVFNLVNTDHELYLRAQKAYIYYTRYIFCVQYTKNSNFNKIDWKKLAANFGIKK